MNVASKGIVGPLDADRQIANYAWLRMKCYTLVADTFCHSDRYESRFLISINEFSPDLLCCYEVHVEAIYR